MASAQLYVRVRATGSRPDGVCLCEMKQAIKDNLQGQRIKNATYVECQMQASCLLQSASDV
eukprot:363378-Chlamydomonas_euryale.AAC.39